MNALPILPTTDITGAKPLGAFAVKRIICIARNYADHAHEMGHEPDEPPFYFFKPLTALDLSPHFKRPSYSENVQFELELTLAIGHGGKHLTNTQAGECIAAFGLGLDMTCRDLQKSAKQAGRPWDSAKGFDGSARCSALTAGNLDTLKNFGDMTLALHKAQGQSHNTVQQGNWQDMIWSPTQLICHLSKYIRLIEGDLIYTGTPAGVGPVLIGDTLVAKMQGFPHQLHTEVVSDHEA